MVSMSLAKPAHSLGRIVVMMLVIGALVTARPLLAQAEGGDPGRGVPDPHQPNPAIDVKTGSGPGGFYVDVSIHQTSPGAKKPDSSAPTLAKPGITPPPSGSRANPSPDKFWSDGTGIYEQTPNGHVFYLTSPGISAPIDAYLPVYAGEPSADWHAAFFSHPHKTPYVLYLDGKYQKTIWVPNSSGKVRLGPAPVAPSIPGPPPSGNGSSTDPHEVALSLLDSLPLPDIQIGVNPTPTGLVNLSSWFWVRGYEGGSFGNAKTVTIPPSVGSDVPYSRVPKDDPRRRATSFTVSVQAWATDYVWNFGDGGVEETHSLGQPYPVESAIRHSYSSSSLGHAGGYPVTLTVVFAATYRVSSGGGGSLPSVSHTYTLEYPVQEAQAILTH